MPTRADGESKGQTPAPVATPCFVYILVCSDGSYYVGSTSDLRDRERIHNEGHGAEYTATRRPVRMVYSEPYGSAWESNKAPQRASACLRAILLEIRAEQIQETIGVRQILEDDLRAAGG